MKMWMGNANDEGASAHRGKLPADKTVFNQREKRFGMFARA
jgi:hypothetical protein